MSDIPPGDNRLRGIDPEKLMLVETEEIAHLLALQYQPLVDRADDLLARSEAWFREHKNTAGRAVIKDDADMNAASDFFRQVNDHAGKTGEVEETRKRVKQKPFEATKAIDAFFVNLRDRLTGAMQVIDASQNAYATEKAARERRVREEAERQAAVEAERVRLEAEAETRRAAEAAIKAHGDDEAVAEALAVEEAAQERIAQAEETAAIATAQARASTSELTRTRSVLGTTTSAATNWKWKVTDMRALLEAALKGDAPMDFLIPNETMINAAVRGKNGRRACPGLEIFPEHKVRRTGA